MCVVTRFSERLALTSARSTQKPTPPFFSLDGTLDVCPRTKKARGASRSHTGSHSVSQRNLQRIECARSRRACSRPRRIPSCAIVVGFAQKCCAHSTRPQQTSVLASHITLDSGSNYNNAAGRPEPGAPPWWRIPAWRPLTRSSHNTDKDGGATTLRLAPARPRGGARAVRQGQGAAGAGAQQQRRRRRGQQQQQQKKAVRQRRRQRVWPARPAPGGRAVGEGRAAAVPGVLQGRLPAAAPPGPRRRRRL